MVVHRTCHGKQLETESIYHLTDPPCSAHVLICPGHIPRKTALSPGGTGLSLPWLKACGEEPAPQARTGITPGSREAGTRDGLDEIHSSSSGNKVEGRHERHQTTLFQQQQPKLVHGAGNSKQLELRLNPRSSLRTCR